MNRSILIVICDFLLVSLVAFTTVDVNKLSDQGAREMKLEVATNRVDSSKDLTAVMRLALDEERKNRFHCSSCTRPILIPLPSAACRSYS